MLIDRRDTLFSQNGAKEPSYTILKPQETRKYFDERFLVSHLLKVVL